MSRSTIHQKFKYIYLRTMLSFQMKKKQIKQWKIHHQIWTMIMIIISILQIYVNVTWWCSIFEWKWPKMYYLKLVEDSKKVRDNQNSRN